MKEIYPRTPSITQLKDINIRGYKQPKKVTANFIAMIIYNYKLQFYDKNGIPFYAILPQDIVSQCLGDPIVASSITRFPNHLECDSVIG